VAGTRTTALEQVGGEWVDRMAQVGLVARGVVYVVTGVLTFELSRGDREEADAQGAIKALAAQPFGTFLLVVIGLGLAAYAATCVLGAVRGYGGKKGGSSDAGQRAADAVRAVVNGALAVVAASIVANRSEGESGGGRGGGGGSQTEQGATATVLDWPGGVALVALIGLAVVGFGVYQGVKAVTRSFTEGLDLDRLAARARHTIELLGVAGYAARGVVLVAVGVFISKAALDYDPDEAVGVDGALARLARGDAGPWLLAAVAVGLIAFGLWSMVEARYRRPSG
jgi:hypothetical protein